MESHLICSCTLHNAFVEIISVIEGYTHNHGYDILSIINILLNHVLYNNRIVSYCSINFFFI